MPTVLLCLFGNLSTPTKLTKVKPCSAMAAATSHFLPLSSSSTLIDYPRKPSPQCVSLVTPPPVLQPQSRHSKVTFQSRKLAQNVVAMAMGEAQVVVRRKTSVEVATAETPEIIKKAIEAWDKVEDKYAVVSLALAGGIGIWGSVGLVAAIDRLPLVPGIFELVGIGYTAWFTYINLIFKPDREALIAKVKELYKEILGSS